MNDRVTTHLTICVHLLSSLSLPLSLPLFRVCLFVCDYFNCYFFFSKKRSFFSKQSQFVCPFSLLFLDPSLPLPAPVFVMFRLSVNFYPAFFLLLTFFS